MNDNDSSVGMGGGLALALIFVLASCAACGYGASVDSTGVKVGRPQDFAAATGVARSADLALTGTAQALEGEATRQAANTQATATAAAVQMQATGTAIAGNAIATATAAAQIAQATQTAVPWQAPLVANAAQTVMVNNWTGAAALVGGVIVAFFFGLAVVAFAQTRAKLIPRDASGQLPGVLIGNTVTDPQRQIGPAVTMPALDLLYHVERVRYYLKNGEVLPLPVARVQLTDAGATADHLLEAARMAGQVTTAAAVFRPGLNDAQRKGRVELVQKQAPAGLLGGAGGNITRVVITGDSAIEQIAAQLGDRLPKLDAPRAEQETSIVDMDRTPR